MELTAASAKRGGHGQDDNFGSTVGSAVTLDIFPAGLDCAEIAPLLIVLHCTVDRETARLPDNHGYLPAK